MSTNLIYTPGQYLSENLSITLDVAKTRTHKVKQSTTHYIPIRCNQKALLVQVSNQVLASNAKLPSKQQDSKFMTVAFKKLSAEDIPYKKTAMLEKTNNEFITFLDTVVDQYEQLAESIDAARFKLPADRNTYSIRQSSRMDVETGEEVEIDPIYRLKLPISDGRIGTNYKEFKSSVVNDKTNQVMDLTVDQAKSFITYGSLASFILNFECVVVSKSGVSLRATIKQIRVLHKKPNTLELSSMNDFADGSDGDYEDPDTNSRTTKKPMKKLAKQVISRFVDEPESD